MKERKFIADSVKKVLVTEYIRRETETSGFGSMEMKRTPFGTNITLYVNKPGLVIGRKGSKVQEITEHLEKSFKLESPQIEVKEIDRPDLNPNVVSKKIALTLEKGWSYRRAGNTALRKTIENNCKGVIIRMGGKLSGERARSQKFIHGSIKYSGEPARTGMQRGFSVAKLKLGIIGISVGILDSSYRLPDEITFDKTPLPVAPKEVEETIKPEGGEIAGTESKAVESNE
ncbi:MAG: 30S ribosomal protein S3 [Candidatus Thermoplasmatota archaeon]|jgi:small subunit ribosomal protein S3|nr:30S ribosomal protein S3 [Candidatus Thermoplasmatota archaeon]